MRINEGGVIQTSQQYSQGALVVGGDKLVVDGGAFSRGSSLGASSGNYSHIQLKNPAGSGVDVFIDSFIAGCNSGAYLAFGILDADLVTVAGPWYPMSVGGAQGNAVLRQQQTSYQITELLFVTRVVANNSDIITPPYPIRLEPGKGLVGTPVTQNVAFNVTYTGREVTL